MKKSISVIITLICITLITSSYAGGFSQDADAIENAAKSVLKLVLADENNNEEYYTGSGFIAFNNNILITNYHVIEDTTVAIASDDDDTLFDIDYVLCADKEADVAILEISGPKTLTPLELYPDNQLKRGSQVVAIGSPEGIKNSVSTGIISSQYVDENNIPMIQITAPISHGSSGGALFNDDGKVIGITTSSITSGQNLNFAINISVAVAMYNAWDGEKYTLANHKTTAKMDFANVYQHEYEPDDSSENNGKPDNEIIESWVCQNCGKENTSKYCQNCGSEKPYWICSCGKTNSGQFCGDCGKGISDLVTLFNNATVLVEQNNISGAIDILQNLEHFNSGSFDTVIGDHADAQQYICKIYYDEGVLHLDKGEYDEAITAFQKAGDFQDADSLILRALYEKADLMVANKQYKEAIALFTETNGYSDSEERISEIYYIQAEDALEKGKMETAIDFFSQAGEYKDSADRIAQIKADEKENKYQSAVKAFEGGYYLQAIDLFTQVSDYKDANEKKEIAKIRVVQQKLDKIGTNPYTMTPENKSQLEEWLIQLNEYSGNSEAETLQKQIHYTLACYFQNNDSFDLAIMHYQQAGDSPEISDQLINCKFLKLEKYIADGNVNEAIAYYYSDLKPLGQGKDFVLIKPGSTGNQVKVLLSLIEPLGIKTTGKVDPENYYDDYIPYVQSVEQYLGMNADGLITLDEYSQLEKTIYPGCNSNNVPILLEKLADLSYISKLPDNHSEYKSNYDAAVKKAETAMALQSDGIITHDEYDTIMNQSVEIPAPVQNVKASVKNDTLTVTWSQVPGAVDYEIKMTNVYGNTSSKTLGKTVKTNWTEKDIDTGITVAISVTANKYTVSSEPVSYRINIPIYYKKVTISELQDHLDKYIGKYVEISNAKFSSWRIRENDGIYTQNYSRTLKSSSNYELCILCENSSGLVEFRLDDLNNWDFGDENLLLLCYQNRITSATGKGIVRADTVDWMSHVPHEDGGRTVRYFYYQYGKTVPSIQLENIVWRSK